MDNFFCTLLLLVLIMGSNAQSIYPHKRNGYSANFCDNKDSVNWICKARYLSGEKYLMEFSYDEIKGKNISFTVVYYEESEIKFIGQWGSDYLKDSTSNFLFQNSYKKNEVKLRMKFYQEVETTSSMGYIKGEVRYCYSKDTFSNPNRLPLLIKRFSIPLKNSRSKEIALK